MNICVFLLFIMIGQVVNGMDQSTQTDWIYLKNSAGDHAWFSKDECEAIINAEGKEEWAPKGMYHKHTCANGTTIYLSLDSKRSLAEETYKGLIYPHLKTKVN